MVILGKVGICRAGFLDLLVAISDGNKGLGPIAIENKSPMGPVKDNSIYFGLGPVAKREGVQQWSKDNNVECIPLPSIWYCKTSNHIKLSSLQESN